MEQRVRPILSYSLHPDHFVKYILYIHVYNTSKLLGRKKKESNYMYTSTIAIE